VSSNVAFLAFDAPAPPLDARCGDCLCAALSGDARGAGVGVEEVASESRTAAPPACGCLLLLFARAKELFARNAVALFIVIMLGGREKFTWLPATVEAWVAFQVPNEGRAEPNSREACES
jgi:hypothetical protein